MNQTGIKGEVATSLTDLSVDQLIEHALKLGEGRLASNQALCVTTGTRTGRSPKDRFIVREPASENDIDWGPVNQPISPEQFDDIWARACNIIEQKKPYISHLLVGADPDYQLPVKVITELAWHNLFTKQLFIRPENPAALSGEDGWTILNVPSLKLNPEKDGTKSEVLVALNFAKKRILICGTAYAGEMKKGMFTVLNYLLPAKGVLPMHCSANVGKNGDVALFFGLSGTGKTTLSADPDRFLIGDDEHGWSPKGIFNFEGGCYAKCINLSQEREPMIWNAIRYGAVVENVVLDAQAHPDYDNDSITENTRAAYPRDFISPCVEANQAGQPQHVIFLTCDLYGVLPPVAKLTKHQAAYHFLSGYTALIGSTEFGSEAGIKPTFSTCFGAPFFPRLPKVYAELLMHWIEKTKAQVYLVNTGWTGGAYGVGQRFSIPTTRAIVRSILNGDVLKAKTQVLPGFKLEVPMELPGIETRVLNPQLAWDSIDAYQQSLNELMKQFANNFKRFDVSDEIRRAGPSDF